MATKFQCRFCRRADFKNAAGKSAHERSAHSTEFYKVVEDKMRGQSARSPRVAFAAPAPDSAPPDDLAAVKAKWTARLEQIHQELVHMEELQSEVKELERLIAGVDQLMKPAKTKSNTTVAATTTTSATA